MIIGFLEWQIFNALMGVIEGAYWHFRNIVVLNSVRLDNPYFKRLDLHPYLFALRVLFAIMIIYNCIDASINSLILFATSLLISQPFFHLGMMYWHRNKLDSRSYVKGFYDVNVVEKDDSSKLDILLEKLGLKQISFRLRLAGLIVAVVILLYCNYYLS